MIEEILDWRPYDYVTDRTIVETPAGPVRFVHTIEFEPTTDGTMIRFRFAPPNDAAGRAIAADIADDYGDALRSAVPALIEQLKTHSTS
ncbi:MAG: hypothetical protein M5U23_12845 [Acidimicrobiia bacterium]|nr:hypothetical protein [Acidimicrobiia bacterium]